MFRWRAWTTAGIVTASMVAGFAADAQFVPPAGYGSKPGPDLATPAEQGAPVLTRVPDASISKLFSVDPAYPRAKLAHAKIVGAFAIAEPVGTRLVSAWALGFLPVLLTFSDGRCFLFAADYNGGTLSNGSLHRADCEHRSITEQSPPPPSGRSLRRIGSSWGYGAWADDRTHTTIITVPFAKTFEPFFTTRMRADAIAAMNGPDWPGGNVTLVGRINDRLMVVTLEVTY